mgnify:CR=1 FL=1
MKEIKISPKAKEVLEAAKAAKVSAMNDQFVPSYALENGHIYVILDDMLIATPRISKITGADGAIKEVPFMEMHIADITDPENIQFKKISCGQIYNQFKVIETGKREFKMSNLRELAEGDLITPSLKMLVTALCAGDVKLTATETVTCELFGADIKDITFFKGEFEKHDDIREKFNQWIAK